jgi:nitrate reductase gamma subunit
MKKLLSFKHWQLFLLIFICGAWTSPSPLNEIINSVAVVTFTLWVYAIGVYGQEQIAELGLKPMNLKLFKTNLLIVGVFFLVGLAFSAIQGEVNQTTTDTFELKDIIYTVGGLYLAFAMVQTIIFACKTIAKLEYRREVSFGDYFNNLLLMFFFFVGIWFLQPKVNRLIMTEEEVRY